ncbi:aromatic ring-hydroxylating dioxygenase subunit alpha [Amycolatopsis pithecellobii]|uniref:Aromatic ring-hydroxylating dioxygenase subunit alpha n=1 Tax=Amycolatopsis pithecellobii TaxID=664692 RepID=A0A6N7Z363_9PSEU|nr:aromatic ring-hydroxylating dioxygenase subunit alpha [Amycolatopsis pithecellobii]MTD55499.1 aromatic ring-hydroxylating dioxygenase subunit alpha [Amycolatopsis pithecellobii]
MLIPGQERIPRKAHIQAYPVHEVDDMVWVWLGDPAKADPSRIVRYPWHGQPDEWPNRRALLRVHANSLLLVDNLMDLTHLAYLHASTVGSGNADDHVTAETELDIREDGLKFTRWMMGSTPASTYGSVSEFAGAVDRWQELDLRTPGCIVQYSGSKDAGTGAREGRREGGLEIRIIHGITPETEDSCLYFFSISTRYNPRKPDAIESLFKGVSIALDEDKEMLEGQAARLKQFGDDDHLVAITSDAARLQVKKIMERLANRGGLVAS